MIEASSNTIAPKLLESLGIDPKGVIRGSINFASFEPITVTITRYATPAELDHLNNIKTEVKKYSLKEL